jgi:glycerol-3-phosphate acyltransferase PlsX
VITQVLREELPRGWRGKLGCWLLRPNLKQVKRRMDYVEYGGALLLGVNGICVITHGSSKAPMVYHAIRLAKEAAEQKILQRLQAEMVDPREPESNPRRRTRPLQVYSGSGPEVLPLGSLERTSSRCPEPVEDAQP